MYQDNSYRDPITLIADEKRLDSFQERMKVAIVLMHFNYGGGERMVSLLASNLDINKLDARVYCIYGDPQGTPMEQEILNHGVSITYLRKGIGFSLRCLFRVWQEMSAFKPEVIHTHLGAGVYCAPWTLFHKSRMIHTLHSIPEKESGRIRSAVMRCMYKLGKAIPVAISDTNRKLTASYYNLDVQSVECVVNPVNASAFETYSKNPWPSRSYDFIHIARFEDEKNHHGFVHCIAKMIASKPECKDVKIALVGGGPLEEVVKSEVVRLGISDNVTFLGIRDDIPALLGDSRCLILPSKFEGLPMTILEAMAAGLPVIATRVGGVPDVVEDGVTGLLAETGDERSLISAMEALYGNEELSQRMGSEARKRIGRYASPVVAEEYSTLYIKYRRR